jgi:hypothetical protein
MEKNRPSSENESTRDRHDARPDLNENTVAAVESLEASGRRVQVIGRVVNGRLELDQESLNEMAKKFPNANMAFVAVNAPFDPASDVIV